VYLTCTAQVSFAIGLLKKGVAGGMLSGMLFQYPGLLMMSVIGFLAERVDWTNGKYVYIRIYTHTDT
jgi:chromate transport protein ChrA